GPGAGSRLQWRRTRVGSSHQALRRVHARRLPLSSHGRGRVEGRSLGGQAQRTRFPAGDEPALSPAAQRACDLSGWGHAHLDVRPASAGERSAGTARPVLPSEHGLRRSSLLPSGELLQPGRHDAVRGLQREAQPARRAAAMVPAPMLELLEGGPSAMARARQAFEHAVSLGEAARGPAGETIVYRPEQVRLLAPLPNPTSLRDFIAFEEHIAATSKKRGQSIPPEWYK